MFGSCAGTSPRGNPAQRGGFAGKAEKQLSVAGIARDELRADLDVDGRAELIMASVQGSYVLARAADSEVPFRKTIRGLLAILKTLAP